MSDNMTEIRTRPGEIMENTSSMAHPYRSERQELMVACPKCKKLITESYPYPEGGYNENIEKLHRSLIGMSLLRHMTDNGCIKVSSISPYEKCHKCEEMALWEEMHMHNDEVYCDECYSRCLYTGDWNKGE